ncbi:acyl-CoA synthetase [Williamsia soli]|uniref:acyl-CoA synthetase n=1 Tax=Williamsia soli TaxID=364929 RepID=UPI001A9F8EFC|nr:acyl-CoA synthetase [Williamsia soli]
MYPGAHVATSPDKAAAVVVETGEVLTYRDLEERSRRLARYLFDSGLRPGDHLAVLTDNTPRVFEVYWAAMRSGLYLTAVNRHLAADEIAYIVNDCGAGALIVSQAIGDTAAAILPLTDVGIRLTFGGDVVGYESYEEALDAASTTPLPSQPRGADMLYSSGTTGRPKGIKPPLPQHQIDEPGDVYTAVFGPMYGFGPDTVYLSPAPIYHAAPLRFGGIVQALGGTVVMMQRFDAQSALAAIEQHSVTHSQWVPTMFVRLLQLPDEVRRRYDTSTLRVAVHAAAPCPADVKRAMIDWWGPILYEYYSSTEGNGITFIDSREWLDHPGSVGRAAVGVIHVCDDDGVDVAARDIGTVYFERDTATFEYHNDPAKTVAAQHPEHSNWITTGDVGYVDDEGYLYLTDRKSFMIISGGVNIYPQEIENALTLHPKVFDVAVIGVPDPDMGEQVKAVVQPAAEAVVGPALANELAAYLGDRIARYKIPKTFDFVDDLPRTPTGKLVKRLLLQKYSAPAAPLTPSAS